MGDHKTLAIVPYSTQKNICKDHCTKMLAFIYEIYVCIYIYIFVCVCVGIKNAIEYLHSQDLVNSFSETRYKKVLFTFHATLQQLTLELSTRTNVDYILSSVLHCHYLFTSFPGVHNTKPTITFTPTLAFNTWVFF